MMELVTTPAATPAFISDEEYDTDQEELEIERRIVEESRLAAEASSNKDNTTAIQPVYNKASLLHHAETLSMNLPWVETLEVCQYDLSLENTHDDLKREVAFYNNSLASVKAAKETLATHNIAYKRPVDYFAEMLKSDRHMAQVKDKLIYEQKKIQVVEERKTSVAHKKVAKVLQASKLKERAQAKKDTLKAVSDWKRKRKGQNNSITDDKDLEQVLSNNNKRQKTSGGGAGVNHKRLAKDKKFGYGGRAAAKGKRNDKKSTDDSRSFSRGRNNADVKANKKSGGANGKRPGKATRQKRRQKK